MNFAEIKFMVIFAVYLLDYNYGQWYFQ